MKPEPLTTNDWILMYLGHEAALLDLRDQLVIVEQERDAARGEAAGLREALQKILGMAYAETSNKSSEGLLMHFCYLAQETAEAAIAVPGKSISEWQAEALDAVAEIVRQTTIDGRSASNRQRRVFQGRYEVIDAIRAESARLRAGGGT